MKKRTLEADRIFRALGDVHRLQIMDLLMERERNAGELLAAVDVVQSTLSHHMKSLCESGLVTARKSGRWTYYAVSEGKVLEAKLFLDRYLSSAAEVSESPALQERTGEAKTAVLQERTGEAKTAVLQEQELWPAEDKAEQELWPAGENQDSKKDSGIKDSGKPGGAKEGFEEKKKAEEKKTGEEKRKVEEKKKAEDKRKAEDKKKPEEKKKAEEKKKIQDKKKSGEKKKAEEKKKTGEKKKTEKKSETKKNGKKNNGKK